MMSNTRKIIIAFMCLFSTSTLFAGVMGPSCMKGNVTMPCSATAWEFGITGLYLQAGLSGFDYITVYTDANGNIRANDLSPVWNRGFAVDGAYYFGTGTDLAASWYHYDRTTTNVTQINSFSLANVTPILLNLHTFLEPKWDAINGEFGQLVDLTPLQKMRVFGGVQVARLTTGYHTEIHALGSQRFFVKYMGVGPRFGAEAKYGWANGFDVYALGASTLLLGHSSFNNLTTGTFYGPAGLATGSKTTIVPELEGKLGAHYAFAMAQGDLVLDAGWLWNNYFNVYNIIAIMSTSSTQSIQSNFALSGPYVGLKWISDV